MVSIVIAVLITGILIFAFQYRRRRVLHELEKKKISEQYQIDLLNAQVESQVQTMQFIGQEIHDSVTQKLTLASIYAQRIVVSDSAQSLVQTITSINAIINDSLTELRDLSRTLTDLKWQEKNLNELLIQECDRVNKTGVNCLLNVPESAMILGNSEKSFLLRVVQEFIQNSLKHSRCNTIYICLEETTPQIKLVLKDNGRGFDTSIMSSSGTGLNNMKRRLSSIGSHFKLTSKEGEGTKLEIVLDKINIT